MGSVSSYSALPIIAQHFRLSMQQIGQGPARMPFTFTYILVHGLRFLSTPMPRLR